MGFVTYILLVGLLLGRANRFHPALLGSTASTAFAVLVFETIMVRLGCYLLGVGQEGGEGWADVVAVLGYKFVGIIVTMLIKFLLPWSSLTYGVFIYVAFAHGFFLVGIFVRVICHFIHQILISLIRKTSCGHFVLWFFQNNSKRIKRWAHIMGKIKSGVCTFFF